MSLINWVFGPRKLKIDLGDRVISELLYRTATLDKENLLKSYKNKEKFKQMVGFIYGSEVFVEINFNKKELEK